MLPAIISLFDPMQYDFGMSSLWSTVKYPADAENGFVSGSIDRKTILDLTFKTYVLHCSHHLQADRKFDAVDNPRAR
jgi:hypothetical protein